MCSLPSQEVYTSNEIFDVKSLRYQQVSMRSKNLRINKTEKLTYPSAIQIRCDFALRR